jgi:hypothetical protein
VVNELGHGADLGRSTARWAETKEKEKGRRDRSEIFEKDSSK